jgi:hypothetical protein
MKIEVQISVRIKLSLHGTITGADFIMNINSSLAKGGAFCEKDHKI